MLSYIAVVGTLAMLVAAQSTSATPSSQPSASPAPPAASYAGSQSAPGFGFAYPKNGSYYAMQPAPSSESNMYPWSGVGVWPAIMEIPNERFNETLTLTIYNTNHTDDPSKTYFTMNPRPHIPATNKTWPTDWHWANISSYPGVLQQWQSNPIVPGGGYYLKLTSDFTTSNVTTYAVSELFEIRETTKTDSSLPGGPYGPVRNSAGGLLPSFSLVCVCAVGVWCIL